MQYIETSLELPEKQEVRVERTQDFQENCFYRCVHKESKMESVGKVVSIYFDRPNFLLRLDSMFKEYDFYGPIDQ